MRFFVDTADVSEIRELAASGLLDGVTTNPSLVAKTGKDFKTTIREICAVVEGPVSALGRTLDRIEVFELNLGGRTQGTEQRIKIGRETGRIEIEHPGEKTRRLNGRRSYLLPRRQTLKQLAGFKRPFPQMHTQHLSQQTLGIDTGAVLVKATGRHCKQARTAKIQTQTGSSASRPAVRVVVVGRLGTDRLAGKRLMIEYQAVAKGIEQQ